MRTEKPKTRADNIELASRPVPTTDDHGVPPTRLALARAIEDLKRECKRYRLRVLALERQIDWMTDGLGVGE